MNSRSVAVLKPFVKFLRNNQASAAPAEVRVRVGRPDTSFHELTLEVKYDGERAAAFCSRAFDELRSRAAAGEVDLTPAQLLDSLGLILSEEATATVRDSSDPQEMDCVFMLGLFYDEEGQRPVEDFEVESVSIASHRRNDGHSTPRVPMFYVIGLDRTDWEPVDDDEPFSPSPTPSFAGGEGTGLEPEPEPMHEEFGPQIQYGRRFGPGR